MDMSDIPPSRKLSLTATLAMFPLSQEDCLDLSPCLSGEFSALADLRDSQAQNLEDVFKGGASSSSSFKVGTEMREFKHKKVPKSTDLAEKYNRVPKDVAHTTVMIRNIPSGYNQREIMRELNAMGFEGTYDFFYMPLDSGTMSNVGYAFVNFADSADAERCMKALDKYRFKQHRRTSSKVASVSIAHIQGLEANLAHYEKCAVNSPKMKQFRPVVLPVIAKSLCEQSRSSSKTNDYEGPMEGLEACVSESHSNSVSSSGGIEADAMS